MIRWRRVVERRQKLVTEGRRVAHPVCATRGQVARPVSWTHIVAGCIIGRPVIRLWSLVLGGSSVLGLGLLVVFLVVGVAEQLGDDARHDGGGHHDLPGLLINRHLTLGAHYVLTATVLEPYLQIDKKITLALELGTTNDGTDIT